MLARASIEVESHGVYTKLLRYEGSTAVTENLRANSLIESNVIIH